MRISASRSQLIWSPLIGWALISCAVSPALAQAQAPAGPPDATTTVTPVPGAGGASPSGTVPATTFGTTPDTSTTGGTPPDNTTPGAAPTAGSTAGTSTTTPTTTSSFAGVPDVRTAPLSLTSSTGSLIYGAPVGTSIPIGGGGGAGPGGNELGISVGAFTLYPGIDITTGLDSNVFAQNSSSGSTTSSPYMTVVPTLELRSEWVRHQLRVALSGGFGFYSNAPTQNYQNYGVTVDGKLEIREDFNLTPSIGFKRATEALGTPNTAFAQAPTVVDTVPVKLGVYQRFNRFFYDVSGSATRYWHYDNSVITSSGLPASSRDRYEYEERFRFGYEISDDLSLYLQPTMNQVRYINATNSADQQRDNDNLGIAAGAVVVLGPTSSFDGNLGYTSRSYSSGLGGTNEITGSLNGTWNGYTPLTLRPSLSRSIQETALSNYKNMVLTTLGMDFNYVIHDAWTAIGGLSYTLSDYTPADGTGAVARTDKILRGQIGFMYSLRPQVLIGPVFEYTSGSSTDSTNGPAYDRETISIRLTAKR